MNFYNIFNSYEFNSDDHALGRKVKFLFNSFFFSFFLISIIVLIVIYPLDFMLTDVFHFESIKKMISQSHKQINTLPFYLIIFIAPFFEEVLFRLWLNLNRLNISVSIGLLSYLTFGGKILSFNLDNILFIKHLVIGLFFFSYNLFFFIC